MLNPFENPHLDAYFQRLNAPLRQIPAPERAEMHEELRQHLEALVAAYEEAGCTPAEALEEALARFGDPARIGRRLLREWQKAMPRDRSDLKTVLFALAMYPLAVVVVAAAMQACATVDPGGYRWQDDLANLLVAFGVPALAGGVTGWWLRQRGVVGMFYAMIALLAFLFPFIIGGLPFSYAVPWLAWGAASAYLGSAWRSRRFYRFPWSLLRLRLK